MPVPPLPLELVRLVLSFAAASLPELERREECIKFALVCRAWKDIAIRLAWEVVSLWKAGYQYVAFMEHLAQSPQLSGLIKRLDLRTPVERDSADAASTTEPSDSSGSTSPEPNEVLPPDDFPRLDNLLPLCSTVQHVVAPFSSRDDILLSLANAPFAPKLRKLVFRYVVFGPHDLGNVSLSLRKFSNVRTLVARAALVGTGSMTLSQTDFAPTDRIPVANLELDAISTDDADPHAFPRLFAQTVITVIRIETLHECAIHSWDGDLALLDPFHAFPNLATLVLFCTHPDVVSACALAIWTTLKPFAHLKSLSMLSTTARRLADGRAIIVSNPSPVPLLDVLRAVPATFRSVVITGLHFEDLDGVSPSTMDDKAKLEGSCDFVAMQAHTVGGAGEDTSRVVFDALVCKRCEIRGGAEWRRIVPKPEAATPAT